MAGYSKTPLPKKLGIKDESRVEVLNAPARFMEKIGRRHVTGQKKAEVVILFVYYSTQLEKQWRGARKFMEAKSGLWICWPNRNSAWPTDLTDDLVREIMLPSGLVDNKVCAIDDFWSAQRFVVRLVDRENFGKRRPRAKPKD